MSHAACDRKIFGACIKGSFRHERLPIGCGRKCQFLTFLLREVENWLPNHIKLIISCIKPSFFRLDTAYLKNKNITSSGRYHWFSVYFRFFRNFLSPVTSETTLSARTRRFPITCKKPFDDISNLWPVIWSSVFNYLKKATLAIINEFKKIRTVLLEYYFLWVNFFVQICMTTRKWL